MYRRVVLRPHRRLGRRPGASRIARRSPPGTPLTATQTRGNGVEEVTATKNGWNCCPRGWHHYHMVHLGGTATTPHLRQELRDSRGRARARCVLKEARQYSSRTSSNNEHLGIKYVICTRVQPRRSSRGTIDQTSTAKFASCRIRKIIAGPM